MSKRSMKLMSREGEIFELDIKIAQCSGVFRSSLEGLGRGLKGGGDKHIPLRLPFVESQILKKVVEWAAYHKDDFEYKQHNDTEINEWDAEFLEVDVETLMKLTWVAKHLDIKGLIYITRKKVAGVITGRTTQELRKIFNIKNDLTSDELEQAIFDEVEVFKNWM